MDTYDRIARLYPAYIAMMPASVLAIAVAGTQDWWKLLLGVVAGAGLPYLLTDLVRRYGKRKQAELFRTWGGPPTTDLLRHHPKSAATEGNPVLRGTRRTAITRLSGVELPSPAEELDDPDRADQRYDAAVRVTRKKLADDPHLAREVRHYGLWRNLYGIRPGVMIVGGTVFVIALALILADRSFGTSMSTPLLIVDSVVSLAMLIFGYRVLTPDLVHGVAVEYAEQLMQSASAR